jgi:hypothetical protein
MPAVIGIVLGRHTDRYNRNQPTHTLFAMHAYCTASAIYTHEKCTKDSIKKEAICSFALLAEMGVTSRFDLRNLGHCARNGQASGILYGIDIAHP